MKPTKNLFLSIITLAAVSASGWGQTAASTSSGQPAITASDLQVLKDALAAQERQVQALQDQLKQHDQLIQQALTTAAEAVKKAQDAEAETIQALNQWKTDTIAPKPLNAIHDDATLNDAIFGLQESAQTASSDQPQTFNKQMEGPLTIHFRGINITPGGYAAAEFVRRSKALGADLPTPFNSVPMPGATQSQLSEFFGSARQSKITTFVDGRMKNVGLSSYISADFLSAGVTSTSTETDSYTLRMRQAWGQVKFDNGWSFLGGQEWSLTTENGKGISPDDDLGRTNDARPKTIDPSYNVGFVFARQYGLRVARSFSDKVAIAFAIENPQGTLTTHGNGDNFVLGQPGASNSYNTLSTYTFNPSPDIIAKAAFDPGVGHYEIFGLLDRFTGRVYPCGEVALTGTATTGPCPNGVGTGPSAVGAYNTSKEGGGVGASARWKIPRNLVFGLKGFGGSGVGRYGPAGLPDLSINGNGTPHIVKNLMGLGTLEWNHKKINVDLYAGVEYASRTYSVDPLTGKEVGYGAPTFKNYGCYTELAPALNTGFTPTSLSNCTADSRAVIEGTAALWYRFYNGPRGRFQFGTQYSYLTRQSWSGVGFTKGTSVMPEGIDNMVFASFRYYLP